MVLRSPGPTSNPHHESNCATALITNVAIAAIIHIYISTNHYVPMHFLYTAAAAISQLPTLHEFQLPWCDTAPSLHESLCADAHLPAVATAMLQIS